MSSRKLKPKEDSNTTVSHSKKRRPSSELPWCKALRRMTSTSLTGGSSLWSWDYTRATTDSMPTCSGKWSWHHHRPATAVLKTRQLKKYCRDARFCRQQEQTCSQRQSSYTPNSTATGGTGEDRHIHLADWTLSVAATEKNKCTIALPGADQCYAGNNSTNFTFHGWG